MNDFRLPPSSRELIVPGAAPNSLGPAERPVYAMQGPPPEPPGVLMEYWRAVRARAKLVIVIGVLGAVAGIVFTISQVPVYRTHTSVKMPEGSTDSYATHSKMLQSEGVKSKALAKLRYGVSQYPPGPTDRITGIRTSLGFRTPSQEDAINQAVTTLEARAGFGTPIVDVWSESTPASSGTTA